MTAPSLDSYQAGHNLIKYGEPFTSDTGAGGFSYVGIGKPNPVKLGRCILELERIYGIKHGNNQHSEDIDEVAVHKTKSELMKELGIVDLLIPNSFSNSSFDLWTSTSWISSS